MILDSFARLFLFTTSEAIYISVILGGFLFGNRPAFAKSTLILVYTLLLNAYLKSVFQIPLNPDLHKEGWAFPSGHMQASFVFWGWLAWEFKSVWFYNFVILLLSGIALALIHFEYHTFTDVGGAILFGLLSLTGFSYIIKLRSIQLYPWILGCISLLISLFLTVFLPLSPPVFGKIMNFLITKN